MDLLLVSRCPPYPLHLGDRLIPYHLARQLAARGHHIDLLAFYSDPVDPGATVYYEHFFRRVQLIPEPRRTAFAYLTRQLRMYPQHAANAWSADMWTAISERLSANRYDVVQLFGGVNVYEFRQLVQYLPNVIVPYESYSLFLERRLSQQGRALAWLSLRAQLAVARRYERQMFNGYRAVVVLSEADEQALHTLAPRLPIHVIPNGVDTDYFTPGGREPDQPVLLFVGNYAYAPNVDAAQQLAQQIFPVVKRQAPQARLLLVGSNPPPSVLSLADSAVEVAGHVPDVRPYLERALIVVSPLRFGAGIKNKVLEAMAMQKPIVATPLSFDGIARLDGEQHALLGTTTDELASAVLRLIGDPTLRRRMGLANRRLIESRYTWACVADQYEALYRHVIEGVGKG